jgi:penicillin-binding protein 1C
VWLARNEVHNAAALITDTRTGKVLAYVGNVNGHADGADVDIIASPRSSGSILKPLLYAAAQQAGRLMPSTLLPDIPSDFSGYSPRNFFPVFDGAVPADEALMRSLNIPYVFLLRDVGIDEFHRRLKAHGLTTISRPPAHYGLSLILGGAEVTLWDITRAYAQLGEVLMDDTVRSVQRYVPDRSDAVQPAIERGAAWLTLEALTGLNRPVSEGEWQIFSSGRRVAWKTGTSFGLRDAWAVGVTPEFTIGVWVGNADGEGRPGITGITAAAPLMFDLINHTGGGAWFSRPNDALQSMVACRQSGMKAGPYCPEADTVLCHKSAIRTANCRYHLQVFTDRAGQRATSECMEPHLLTARPWFVLPPLQEWYYRRHHPDYGPLPHWAPGCGNSEKNAVMEWIYPRAATSVIIPREMDGTRGKVVFELAHARPAATVYWHMDGTYLGRTTGPHKMEMAPAAGPHTFTVVDGEGNSLGLSVRVER